MGPMASIVLNYRRVYIVSIKVAITIFNGKIHYKWPFSIAMLNYQRVVSIKVAIHLVDPNLHQSSNDSRSASDLGHAAFILEAETAMFAKAETLWRPIPKGLGENL